MAEGDKKNPGTSRISEKQRYNYIGFEVCPGTPKDLFKNDAEKQKLIEGVKAKRESDTTLRDTCLLMEERISKGERIILAVASVAILAALILPWYSAYMVVPLESETEPVAQVVETLDTLAAAGLDSVAGALAADGLEADALEANTLEANTLEANALVADLGDSLVMAGSVDEPVAEMTAVGAGALTHQGDRANVQIITAHTARARTVREYSELTGFGSLASVGTLISAMFSSGFILMITAILMLLYTLLCLALPIINLYSLFGLKGKPDDVALKVKKYLKLNWLPLIIFTAVFMLSFIGAEYGFNTEESFTSLGESYGVGVMLGSMSWGIIVALGASLLVAIKGIEI